MPNNLSGQVDLVAAIEGTALASNTDVASFTDGTNTDTAANFTATIDWGDGVTTTGTVVGSNGSFMVQGGHTYADDDFVSPVVTVTRTTDSAQLVLFGGVNVADADNLSGHSAPTITADPNQALTNVLVATFTDTYTGHPDGSDFTVNIDWGDGTTTAGTLTGAGGSFSVTGSHTYATAGNFTITTFMNDDSPDASFASANTIADIGFGGTEVLSAANETVAIPTGTTVATFADNAGLASTDYTATIDWGDGTTTAGVVSGSGASFTVTSATAHTYADEGQFTEVVTITRTTDNATIAPSGTVTVADTDVLNGSGTTIRSDPNVALTNVTVATFTDSNTVNTAGDFVATVDWGDGTSTLGTVSGSGGSFTVTGSHTYTQNGQDAIVVNVSEEPDNPQAIAFASISSTALIGIAPVSGASINIVEGAAVPGGTQVATFSDSNNSDTAASFTASIDWGDGITTAGTVTGATGSFTVTGGPHTYTGAAGEEGGDTVTTTLTRTSDNSAAAASGAVFIGESDHFTLTGSNVSGSQGTPLNNVQVATFTDTYTGHADGSDFTALIDWGDGTGQTLGTVSGSGGSFTVDGSHTYANPGSDTVTVSVADSTGTATAAGTSTATIAARTLAGQMVLAAATEATALPANTVVATFTDSIGSDMAGDFTATVDWGDGTTTTGTVVGANGSFTVEGGHTYGDEGSDPAVVTFTHTSDNAQATASGTVAVAEGDSLTGQGTSIGPETNQPFSGTVATFTDTDTANVAGDFAASIAWGDGTTTAGTVSGANGAFIVNGSHTYTTPGQDTVLVTLADDAPGTATATATTTATVRTFTGQMVLKAATEGHALANTTSVATFTDSDTADTASSFTATINWGNGVTTAGAVIGSNGSFTVEGGHTYADEGSDAASVTLTHTSDQAQATASGSVAVAEGDVLTAQGLHITPKSGQVFSGAVATFSDIDKANVAGDFIATINWGDGTTTGGTVVGSNGAFTVDGSHTYAEPGREDVLVTLADDAPGTATATADTKATVSQDPHHGSHDDALVVPNQPSNPPVIGGIGAVNVVWQSNDNTLGNWLTNATLPLIGTGLSGSPPGSIDYSTTSGQAGLLFQSTNSGTVLNASDSPANVPGLVGWTSGGGAPVQLAANESPSLASTDSTHSIGMAGSFAVR